MRPETSEGAGGAPPPGGGEMPGPYREPLPLPGARSFVAAGFVGRMSMSMVGIGIVLLVSAVTGSYGIAGSVTATLSLSHAAGAPLSARYADRYGQRRVPR